jgi:ubiquinone/menaquinone biosynthesis C-methylase UbiE
LLARAAFGYTLAEHYARQQEDPMSATDARFAGSIPAIYDQYLVPLLFEPYAADLAARWGELKQGVLVEIAAGTGVVTRALNAALSPGVKLVATDLNEGMLKLGASQVSGPRVTWQQADAQKLPFDDASADGVVCQFGVMFLPDKLAGYREARRILRPGGRYVFNVWNRLEQNEVSDIMSRAVAALFPDDPPRFMARTPFGYFDVAAIRAELEMAGFHRIEIETVEKVSRTSSAEHAAIGLCQGTPLRSEIEARDPARLEEATAAATAALRSRFGDGALDNRMSAHVTTAFC